MAVKKPTLKRIRDISTENSFKGGKRYARDSIRSIRMTDGTIHARVSGTAIYDTTVSLPSLGYHCTCPYDYGGACKHVIAALLYTRENFGRIIDEEKRRRKAVKNLLSSTSSEQTRDFLQEEMERDDSIRGRFAGRFGLHDTKPSRDYRSEIDMLLQEAANDSSEMYDYYDYVDLDQFLTEAQRMEKKRRPEEAIRIYREISEALWENLDRLEDPVEYYSGCTKTALQRMVSCIKSQKLAGEKKRPHISYMFEQLKKGYPGRDVSNYESALKSICTTAADHRYWQSLMESIPNKAHAGESDEEKEERVGLLIYIARRVGTDSAIDIRARDYTTHSSLCLEYAKNLQMRGDYCTVSRVIREGTRRFSDAGFLVSALKFIKKSDPLYRIILRDLYLETLNPEHYAQLQKISPGRGAMFRYVIADLERRRKRNARVDVFLIEKMYRRALGTVLSSRRLDILMEYHGNLCRRFPKVYHAEYKRHLTRHARGYKNKVDYEILGKGLAMMKGVPGHKRQFLAFAESLMQKYPRRIGLAKIIKSL